MNTPTERASGVKDQLRVVIDAQIVLAMFLIRRERPTSRPDKRGLLKLLDEPAFCWLWTPDIISDYVRGANSIETDERTSRHFDFDRVGFQLFLGALQLSPPVVISASTLRNARQRIWQAARVADRDLEDAIYLACAVDGEAHLLTSEDSDLRTLGNSYEGIRIVN